jgi:hypothetical protein
MVPSTGEIDTVFFGFREPHIVRLEDDVVLRGSPDQRARLYVTIRVC